MNYINDFCPVCNQAFTADDDIVVCPDCGAPHHRDCWKIKNACEYQPRHSEGFEWKPLITGVHEPPVPVIAGEQKNRPESGTVSFFPPIRPVENEEDFENLLMRGMGYNKDDNIDGVSIADAALYIQQSAKGYIKKFKTKNFSFNWAAFFFSPAWFFYRKMYKVGAVILALFVALSLFTYPMLEKLDASTRDFQSKVEQVIGDDGDLTSAVLAQNEELLQDSKSLLKGYGMYYAITMLLPGLLSALIANQLYKKKMLKDIAKIKEDAKDEGVQYEKSLIIQRGGVSFLLGALVLFASSYLPEVLFYIGDFFSNTF